MQRNWASMWLQSQAKGLWPERSVPADGTVRKIGEVAPRDPIAVPAPMAPQQPRKEAWASHSPRTSAPESETSTEIDETAYPQELEPIPEERCEIEAPPPAPPIEEHFDANESANAAAIEDPHASPSQRLSDLRVRLRFQRADVYLCLAVLVALLALLWPMASSPTHPSLTMWQRALISLGIAEAPAPVIHMQGDPSIEVWVDPHTALYYCPGADIYGKTTDGRFTSQREAQMDRFEPAGRSACE